MNWIFYGLALFSAGVICWRVLCVAAKISGRQFTLTHCRWRWWGFKASYIALAGAAMFGVISVRLTGNLPLTMLLVATAGMFLFEPRRPKT